MDKPADTRERPQAVDQPLAQADTFVAARADLHVRFPGRYVVYRDRWDAGQERQVIEPIKDFRTLEDAVAYQDGLPEGQRNAAKVYHATATKPAGRVALVSEAAVA